MGQLRAAAGQPGDRRRGSGADRVRRFIFEPTPANMARWRRWWRFANVEQAVTFVLVTVADDLPDVDAGALDAVRTAGPAEQRHVPAAGRPASCRRSSARGSACCSGRSASFSLFASSMGIIDYTSRLAADVLKSTYLRDVVHLREPALLPAGVGHGGARRARSSSVGLQPAARAAGDLRLHRRRDHVPVFVPADRAQPRRAARRDRARRRSRVATLVWSTLFFGVLSALIIVQQLQRFL